MSNVIPFRRREYSADGFTASTIYGRFSMSGTLCGCIDFAVPNCGTYAFTPDEAFAVAHALLSARKDVLDNSRPLDDPRLYDRQPSRPTND